MPVDLGIEAQKAAELRLAYCNYLLFEEEDEEPWTEAISEPCGAFCGCDTCVVREVLDAAWPLMLAAAIEEARALVRRENVRPVDDVE